MSASAAELPWWVAALELLVLPVILALINRPVNRAVRRLRDSQASLQAGQDAIRNEVSNSHSENLRDGLDREFSGLNSGLAEIQAALRRHDREFQDIRGQTADARAEMLDMRSDQATKSDLSLLADRVRQHVEAYPMKTEQDK